LVAAVAAVQVEFSLAETKVRQLMVVPLGLAEEAMVFLAVLVETVLEVSLMR
jgi:hypothetical protein